MAILLTQHQLDLLGSCLLFRPCAPALLEQVLNRPDCTLESFVSGATLHQPPNAQPRLGLVLEGQLQVRQQRLPVNVLGPGDLFGASSLFHEGDYAAVLIPLSPVQALFFTQSLVDQLLEREPLVRHNYLRYLAQRIHFLSGRIQSLAQPGAEVKLARYLLCEQQQGVVSLSAAELARRLSIGRATLYRAFQRLEEDGLIRREGKNVFLPNIPALQAYITQ